MNGLTDEVVLKQEYQLKNVMEACLSVITAPVDARVDDIEKVKQLYHILDAKHRFPGTKIQVKASSLDESRSAVDKVVLIVKWGGEFTHAGRHQSKDLGEYLRKDLKILNREILHDVKIYTSSERRVIATAEIFSKVFLNADDLPSESLIITKEMLDDSNAAKSQMESVKLKIYSLLNPNEISVPSAIQSPIDLNQSTHLYLEKWGSNQSMSIAMNARKNANPAGLVEEITGLMKSMRETMRLHFENDDISIVQARWCCSESPMLFKVIFDSSDIHGNSLNRNVGRSSSRTFVISIKDSLSHPRYRNCTTVSSMISFTIATF